MQITIDAKLKAKCPRTALACVTARVEAAASPAALLEEMKARETEIQKLPYPRGVLESPQIVATRAAYKALGKDPARYRGSAEALLRRGGAGKGVPQNNFLGGVVKHRLVGGPVADRLLNLAPATGGNVFFPGGAGDT